MTVTETTFRKGAPVAAFTKVVDAKQGVVSALVNVTAIEDSDSDVVVPGAHTLGLARVTPKGVWSHDWSKPIAKTLDAIEIMPGDPSLPADLLAAGAGALRVTTQFNMKSIEGSDSFARVSFYEGEQEWSVGYRIHNAIRGPMTAANVGAALALATAEQKAWWASRKDDFVDEHVVQFIFDWDVLEYSPVLWGASPGTRTESVKDARDARLARLESAVERIEIKLGTPLTHDHQVPYVLSATSATSANNVDSEPPALKTSDDEHTHKVEFGHVDARDATLQAIEENIGYLYNADVFSGEQLSRVSKSIDAMLALLAEHEKSVGDDDVDDSETVEPDVNDEQHADDDSESDEDRRRREQQEEDDEADRPKETHDDDQDLLLLYEHTRSRTR